MGRLNPLGFIDHTPFAAFGAELVYGIREDGALVHVSAVPGGLACKCSCPACGGTLIAHKGKIKMEHFRHQANSSGCGSNAETNAHSWAKEVLGRELQILLPPVVGKIGRDRLQTHKERMFTFARAELEKVMGDIVPDVVLTTATGQPLLVEVFVTHSCGPEKIQKLRERGLATLEIDMSRWRKSTDREDIERALIERAPRQWLYNRKLVEAEELLLAQNERRAAEENARRRLAAAKLAAAKQAREIQAQNELNATVQRIEDAVKQAHRRQTDAGLEELQAVRADPELAPLLDPGLATVGFRVSNDRWQAALLMRKV